MYPPIASGSFLPPSQPAAPLAAPDRPLVPKSHAAPRQVDTDAINRLDWGVIATGLVAFLFSLFGYYTYTARIAGLPVSSSESVSAWHGVLGWLAALLAFGSSGLLAVHLIGKVETRFPVRTVCLAGFGLATVCVLLALVVVPGGGVGGFGSNIDEGHGPGYWVSLISIVSGFALCYQRRAETGPGPA